MSSQTVARRYASALADVVLDRGEANEVKQELQEWTELLEANANLQEVFRNPTIALEKKRAVLNKLIERAKSRPTTTNFLKVLLQNQRLAELPGVNRKFEEILDERAGLVAATVTTARPVPQSSQEDLMERLSEITKKKVRVDFEQDPELIGGLVTRIGSTIYDGSVQNQLKQLREKMAG
ncbi:MAG TPA: ATP synthase F1 subunit delta [Pyrinomonadaceae bacterium]|nr:ATP synthase F1 subunit delta [Pyrinomonadaceae bacterium]